MRQEAVQRWRSGTSVSELCAALHVSRSWLRKWILRYRQRSDDWYADRSRRPHECPTKIREPIERLIVNVRLELDAQGLFCGAQNILWELEEREHGDLPSVRTVNRIIERHGLQRREPGRFESKGKRYPTLSSTKPNGVHQSDFLGPCYLTGPVRFYSINSVDLSTARCGFEPVLARDAQTVIDAFWRIWSRLGIPKHQQIDNEMVFYGSPTHPRGMGCLIRLCLLQGVEPWFIPMSEPWRNGVVEKVNHHYRQKFLARVSMRTIRDLRRQSLHFEQRVNTKYRYSKLGGLTPLQALAQATTKLQYPERPKPPQHPLIKPEKGFYHVVRFIRGDGMLDIFGERFRVPKHAIYEYVTATIDVQQQLLLVTVDNQQIDQIVYKLR